MNVDRLFALYDRVAEAPDAVGRLRRFVLDLAVRGKLVQQDPADEPASELLKRISAERARLVAAGGIRRQKIPSALDERPFSVPENWHWAQVREIASDRGQKVPEEPFTYIDVTAIDKENGLVVSPRVLEPSEAPSRARKVAQLVLCSQSLFRFADLGDDGLCRGGPDKGCGVIVSAIDVVVDRLD